MHTKFSFAKLRGTRHHLGDLKWMFERIYTEVMCFRMGLNCGFLGKKGDEALCSVKVENFIRLSINC